MNTNGITESSNSNTKALLEPTGDNRTQEEGIHSLLHVEFVHPPMSLPKKGATPNIDRYIPSFSYLIIRIKCPTLGRVQGKHFQLDVSIEKLRVIHITINNCIVFIESKNPYEHNFDTLDVRLPSH